MQSMWPGLRFTSYSENLTLDSETSACILLLLHLIPCTSYKNNNTLLHRQLREIIVLHIRLFQMLWEFSPRRIHAAVWL